MLLVKQGMVANLSIPDHKELDTGTLRSLIRKAELSVQEFLSALK